MKALNFFTLCIILALMAACGSSRNDTANRAQTAPPPVSHTVFAPYIQDINKAKNVQNTVNAQKQSLDRQIQAQSAGSAPAAASHSPP